MRPLSKDNGMGHMSTAEVMGSLNVVEACLVKKYNDKWIIDLGATNHVLLLLRVVQTK